MTPERTAYEEALRRIREAEIREAEETEALELDLSRLSGACQSFLGYASAQAGGWEKSGSRPS